MIYTLTLHDLARIAYEASRKLTDSLGGQPGVAWEQLPSSERERAILVMTHYHSVHAVKMSSDPYVSLWQGVYAALYEFVPPATQQEVHQAQKEIKAYGIGTSDNRAADNVPFDFVQNAVNMASWDNSDLPMATKPEEPAFSGHGGGFGGGGVSAHYEPVSQDHGSSHSHSSHDYSSNSGSSYDSSSDSSSSSDSGSSSSSD